MEVEHNRMNAMLMARYGASPELIRQVLGLEAAVCTGICNEVHPRLVPVRNKIIEEAIAAAISNAHRMHSESWFEEEEVVGLYTIDDQVCFMVACEQQGLPPRLWYVLHLANHWSNDLADWADNVGSDMYVPRVFVGKDPSIPE